MVKVFDFPIKTNDQSVDRVLAAGLPVLLVFLQGAVTEAMDREMQRLAKGYAGLLLLAEVQLKDNPQTALRYRIAQAPAVAAVAKGQVQASAEGVQAADLEKYAAFLLGKGPRPASPQPRPAGSTPSSASRSAPGQAGSAAGYGRPHPVTDATFDQEVMHSTLPVVVDFWAPWCGPCRMTDPILEKLARELAGRVKIAKVNVDENPYLSQSLGIQSIPTMLVVQNGKVIDRWVGALPEPALRSRIAPLVR